MSNTTNHPHRLRHHHHRFNYSRQSSSHLDFNTHAAYEGLDDPQLSTIQHTQRLPPTTNIQLDPTMNSLSAFKREASYQPSDLWANNVTDGGTRILNGIDLFETPNVTNYIEFYSVTESLNATNITHCNITGLYESVNHYLDSVYFYNCSCRGEPLDSEIVTLYSIFVPIMLSICVVSVFINILVVVSTRWCKKPLSPTLYFSISLALADAFAAVVLGTGLLINSYLPAVHNKCLSSQCSPLTLEAFRLGGVLITVAHLLALAVNHWFGIVRPLQYESTMTRGTALRINFISWICPIVGFLICFSVIHDEGFQRLKCELSEKAFIYRKEFHGIFGFFFFFPLILMTFIYGHIFLIVRDHLAHRIKFQGTQLKKNVKAIVTTFLILGTYIICWGPAVLWYVLVCEDCLYKKVPRALSLPFNIVTNTLIILKGVVNPIIYASRMPDIQNALSKMHSDFRCWCNKLCSKQGQAETRQDQGYGSNSGSVRFATKSFRMTSRGSFSQSNL